MTTGRTQCSIVPVSPSHLRSLLVLSSSGGMDQGRFLGRHSSTSLEKSEKSTSYSMRMPSVSGSISPAWPSVLASLLWARGWREEGVWLALKPSCCSTVMMVHRLSPFCKVAVRRPVSDATYEQRVAVVARTGDKVLGTVGEGHVDPRHPVVHRGEHGKGLVGEELEEACCSSGVFLLNNVHNLRGDEPRRREVRKNGKKLKW